MMTELQELLNDYQGRGHSDFQMDHNITATAGGTTYGQYKQALHEMAGRREGLLLLYNEIAVLRLDLEDALKLQGPRGVLEQDRLRIRIEIQEGRIADTEREFLRFFEQARTLQAELTKDEPLTTERAIELEKELWLFKIVEALASGNTNAIELCNGLAETDRTVVELAMHDRGKNVQKWLREKRAKPPKPEKTDKTAKDLIEGTDGEG